MRLFTAGLLDGTQAYVLAVIEHATRRIRILGVTLHPTAEWAAQQARNLIMDLGEQAHRAKLMIRDRGPNYTAAFDAVLADAGIRAVLCNVRTPRMNAIAEQILRQMDLGDEAHRVMFMIRDRGPNYTAAFDAVLADAGIRAVLCNVRTPRMNAIAEQTLRQYETHHNQHRPHRSLDGDAALKPLPEPVDREQYRVTRQARAGGLINEYHLVA